MRSTLVEESLALDALELARSGLLRPGARGDYVWTVGGTERASVSVAVEGSKVWLNYRPGPGESPSSYAVELTGSPTSFGGRRVWFFCPGCDRRVRILYLPPFGPQFLCRSCHGLTYQSQRERPSQFGRQLRELEKMKKKLEAPRRRARTSLKLLQEAQKLLAETERIDPWAEAPWRLLLPLDRGYGENREDDSQEPGLPRARGRPRKKRPYERRKPFLTTARTTASQVLCLRCRDFREPENVREVTYRNGRRARRGTCPVCGASVSEIGRR